MTREVVAAAGRDYSSPIVGPLGPIDVVRVDVSALTTAEVDTDGVLKPGVPFRKNGVRLTRAGGLVTAVIAGGAAGAHTVTGITTDDTLVSVHHYTPGSASTYADLTSEFSISAADAIDNTGGTSTASDTLVVTYERKEEYVYGVVLEPVKVAAGNTSTLLDAATDIDVAVVRGGLVNRDVAEDNLGRALTATEIAAFQAAGSLLRLTQT